MRRVRRTAVPLLGLATACAACAPNLAAQATNPPDFDRPGEAKCGVHKSQTEPLIVEWPSAARAKLEALSHTGVVAVRYTGCEMEVLASCNAPGKYVYTGITPKRDHVAIRNEDDLYANIPLGAARLEGKLAHSGELDVDMSIVGRYASDRASVSAGELQGPDCSKATHVVSALTIGAFDFSAGAGSTVGGGVNVGGAGGGASSSASKELLNSDGQRGACDAAKTTDKAPPESCGAILRLEVVPLGEAKRDVGPVGAPPPGAVAGTPAALGAGGEVEISVPEKEFSFQATVEAGDKTVSCDEPVTYYKPCRLSGLPEGKAHISLTGSSKFDCDFPISADGRTSLQILHRGNGQEVGMGIATVIGAGATIFGLLYEGGFSGTTCPGCDTTGFIIDLLAVTLGGSIVLLGLPGTLGGALSAHDGVLIETPGKASEMASGPRFEWGGPLAPTTVRF